MSSNPYFLSKGAHTTADDGRCAMEWVSYLAGEKHSASPECVSPVLTAFCVAFNDGLDDEQRQKLRPYLARTIGTRGDGMDEQRSWMAMDWLIRTYTPAWLSLAGLDDAAARLRSLPPVLTAENLSRAMGDLNDAARGAAWRAAWAAAYDAAWGAAWAAAWDAAGGAAWAGVWDGAGDAVWDAAWAGVWGAAGAAVRAAAWRAAWAAAWDAARGAAWRAAWDAAWDAARGAAWDALAPTGRELQESAFELLDRMLPTEIIRLPAVADADLVCGTRWFEPAAEILAYAGGV